MSLALFGWVRAQPLDFGNGNAWGWGGGGPSWMMRPAAAWNDGPVFGPGYANWNRNPLFMVNPNLNRAAMLWAPGQWNGARLERPKLLAAPAPLEVAGPAAAPLPLPAAAVAAPAPPAILPRAPIVRPAAILPEEELLHPPKPYAFGYRSADEFNTENERRETQDESGRVTGFYSFRDANGLMRLVNYMADETGFHADVKTNEPGTETSAPADVSIESAADLALHQALTAKQPLIKKKK